jgi:hypothetical protein
MGGRAKYMFFIFFFNFFILSKMSTFQDDDSSKNNIETTEEEQANEDAPSCAPAKLTLKEIHVLFNQFFNKLETQDKLANVSEHREASFLALQFCAETGQNISLSWVYRMLRQRKAQANK